MSRSNYLQPFPNEFGPTAPNKRSSKDGVVNFDSVSIADSKASSLDTERLTVIRADNTLTRDEGQLYLAPDSRLSNRSMSPATPSPPASPNVKQRKRKTPPPSALSKADSIRSQSPGEDTAESTDHSSSVVPSFDVPHLSQPGTSSPPPVATATKSMLSEMLSSPAPAIKVGQVACMYSYIPLYNVCMFMCVCLSVCIYIYMYIEAIDFSKPVSLPSHAWVFKHRLIQAFSAV